MISNTPPLGQDSSRQLLPGWRGVRFDQMAENITDRVDTPSEAGVEYYVGLEHLDPESLKIRRWGTPDQVEATKLRFRTGDIIFGRRRAYQRKLAVAGFDGICSAHALVLRAREEVVLADFLPFFMQSDIFFERALSISVGSLSPTINWTALAHQQFALPPLDEQRHIADILWAAEEAIEKNLLVWEALVTSESLTFGAVLNVSSATTYSEEFGSGKFDTDIPLIRKNIIQVAEVIYGLTVNAVRNTLPIELPYLRVANVMRGKLDLSEVKMIGCTDEDKHKFHLEKGDVLVVEGHANIDEIGRAAIWHNEIGSCLHQNHILRIRCGSDLNPNYLVAYLNSPYGRSYFRQYAKSTSGLYTINSTVLKQMPILVPLMENQIRINRLIRCFKDRSHEANNHITLLREVKKQLLNSLLVGKLPDERG